MRGVTLLGFDTAPLIYYTERHPTFGPLTYAIFQRIANGDIAACTSVVSLAETLVYPKRLQDRGQERIYKRLLLRTPGFACLPVDTAIAERAAELRARYNLRTPDAIQVATALVAGCEAFLTNDLALRRVADLRVLALGMLTL